MPDFTNSPPTDPRGVGLPLKRCPTMANLVGIVTSSDIIGCPTHFYGGRTVPCEKENCEPCLNGVPWRWHSYCSCWSPSNKVHFLFENTARATEPFVQYRDAHGSLRGCAFRAQRMNSRPNARVFIETKPADLEKITLPDAPDLAAVLSIIWNIPLPQVPTNADRMSVPLSQADRTIRSHMNTEDRLKAFRDAALNPKPA